jgi:HEPN domain-containing protein
LPDRSICASADDATSGGGRSDGSGCVAEATRRIGGPARSIPSPRTKVTSPVKKLGDKLAKQKKKTPEELKDDDARTNSMGLFNVAEAYRLSAMALEKADVKSGHANHPVRFLYYHAIELYLKALLRQKHSVEAIRKKFGHNTRRIVKEAKKLGLVTDDEDRQVFSLMGDTDAVIEARYIRTGAKTWPTFEALNRTCKSMRDSVGSLLRGAGVMVRL